MTSFEQRFYELTKRANLLSHNGNSIEFYIKNNMYKILGNRLYVEDVGTVEVEDMATLLSLFGELRCCV